ncbi:restriction endonuclease subunit S [Desemzia sp. C1]|uniref:restriction endonuclease subunit S n=1 Tax=Desemzia sp. C1 TaxID=2892016 RepID=UPI001E384262|nr:restriction endonuclease subunit S [Desemzia sp. C1]
MFGDWEQRKLSDVADIIGGGTPNTNNEEYWNGDIDWYSPAEIGEQRYVNGSRKKITMLGLQKSSAKILPVGTVLFTSRAGIGNTAILKKGGATNQGFQSILPKENQLDTYFIYSKTDELKRYGEVTGAGSTFIEVSGKQMEKMPISIPSFEEQIKIGNFFKQLDDTIALHQEKLEKLKQLKKGYLQVMFPQKGEKVPQLRFANFSQDWKQRNLNELMDFSNGINAPKENYGSGRKMISVMDILSTDHLVYENILNSVNVSKQTEEKNKVEFGDMIFVRSSEIIEEVGWAKAYLDENYALYSGFSIRGKRKEKYDPIFVEHSLNGISRKQIERKAGGSTRFNVSQEVLNSLLIQTPSFEEQIKIGTFLKELDTTTFLQKKKISILKNIKQELLKKIFN